MLDPGHIALGAWSGGRFMHFGEPLDDQRLTALLRPDDVTRTVITADVYGAGEGDQLVGRALEGLSRDSYCLVGAVGHDFYEGERDGPRGFPRFTDPRLRKPPQYGDYLRMAAERSLERCGVDRFDLLLLHNPDSTGYRSPDVWDAMGELRRAGLTTLLGVAPGPANGFTLDLIDCFERFGAELDWAMVILNPLEPWPGELCIPAAQRAGVRLITRVADYGGLFHDDVLPGHEFARGDHRTFRPAGWVEEGRARMERMRPIAHHHGMSMLQLACEWNLGHDQVGCAVPTLIQEAGATSRPVEDKRRDLAGTSPRLRLTASDMAEIRAIGDNTGCMALKGAVPGYDGEPLADRWPLDDQLAEVAQRWGIAPERDLAPVSG